MNQEYMKEKPVLPLILSMSTPMMLSMLVQSLYNIIDSIFVAKIGEDALAAVSLVYPLQNLITALTVGFGVGMNARIAFYLGAGEKEKADTATSQGIFLGTVHGILVTIAGLFFAPVYLRMYTQDERVLSWSIAYANIIFGMSALLVVGVTFEKVYQAEGKMVTTMTGMMAGCIANIILDPLMIFGIGFFPKMGVQGAAVATGLGWVVTLGYYLWYYFSGRVTLKIRMKEMLPTKEISVRMYQVGIPATLNMALPSLLISALNGMLLCLCLPQGLMGMFTNNSQTIAEGAKALRIISLGFVISAVSVVCAGALEALGKGMSSLVITLLRYVVIILPAAYIGSHFLGVTGVWSAFVIAETLTAIVAILIWKRQRM